MAVGKRLKLWRQVVRADGRDFTVLTLRPGTDVRGVPLAGRLLWGLSYQRRAGTVVVIDRPHFDTNLFDAEQGAARWRTRRLGRPEEAAEGSAWRADDGRAAVEWARAVHSLGACMHRGSEYVFLDPSDGLDCCRQGAEGEMQVFAHYRHGVPVCRDMGSMGPGGLRPLIWGRVDAVRVRAAHSA
ncbi:hypothetical protein DP939_35575 [Spongiactinospora rosea]|uniref:Uncharacterized protein n=1 Tax=Spongiactinospora rosea TaxID=2248750 RepID=A0A366LNB9_9ACTN|nr:hypothetical protein DP939_35575 [Spongiactinospora rosea]